MEHNEIPVLASLYIGIKIEIIQEVDSWQLCFKWFPISRILAVKKKNKKQKRTPSSHCVKKRQKLLLFAKEVSTSVLVSHVDSVSLVQLSWYLGSMIVSARLPPQPIGKIIQDRCSWRGLNTARFVSQQPQHLPTSSAAAPSVFAFPSSVSSAAGGGGRCCAQPERTASSREEEGGGGQNCTQGDRSCHYHLHHHHADYRTS